MLAHLDDEVGVPEANDQGILTETTLDTGPVHFSISIFGSVIPLISFLQIFILSMFTLLNGQES